MKVYVVYCHTLKVDNRKYIGITSLKPNNTAYGYKWMYI